MLAERPRNNAMYEKTILKIPSVVPSWDLDAWRYLPQKGSSGPCPVIIMAHGLSSNKWMGLATYAEAFASLGYACMVLDYRRWGDSDGTPRHCLYVSEQLDDYRTVIKYCRQQPEFDPQRVILWGTSFSGGHVATLLSERKLNIFAGIAQCPYLGETRPMSVCPATLKTVFYAVLDVAKQAIGLKPVYIPAAAAPGEVGVMTTEDAVSGLQNIAQEKNVYPNEIAASSIFEIPFYKPSRGVTQVTCPILLIALENDTLCPVQSAIKFAQGAHNAELVKLNGGHFDLYPGRQLHNASLSAQLAFLKKHIPI